MAELLERAERPLSILASLCWLASLPLRAISIRFDGEHDRILSGWQVLTSGYFDLVVLEFSWLANFLFWVLVWRLWRRRMHKTGTRFASVVPILLTAHVAELFIFPRFFQEPRAYAGLWLWVVANLSLAGAGLLASRRDARDTAAQ